MSQALFPVLPGLAFPVVRTPVWNTIATASVSGRESRASFMQYPRYTWRMDFSTLRGAVAFSEFQAIVGFFNARQGAFDTFLFDDVDDDTATAQTFGTGDGGTTAFQLSRTLGGSTEPVYDLQAPPTIFVNGVAKVAGTDYTLNGQGLVTFTAAPATGAVLTWTGQYYWRVRFDADSQDVSKFVAQLWEAKSVRLRSVKGPSTIVVSDLTLSPSALIITAGSDTGITLTVLDASGAPVRAATATVSSSNTGTATVPLTVTTDAHGQATVRVSGIAVGTVTITVIVSGIARVLSAQVVAAGSGMVSLALTPSSAAITAGNTTTLTLTLLDDTGTAIPSQLVTLSSSAPANATVPASVTTNGSGQASVTVTGVAAGSASITASALGVTSAPCVVTVSARSTVLKPTIAYTDYSTPYQSAPAKAAQQAFIAAKATAWGSLKLMSGGEPDGGYPAAVAHLPYCLLEEVKCYGDGWGSVFVGQAPDFSAYCAAHGVSEESGYLHHTAGQTTFADAIVSISDASPAVVTLQYDTQGAAQVYADGQSVTIAGASNSAFNGTWTISNVTAGVWSGGAFGSGTLTTGTTFTIPTSSTAATGGTVSRTATGAVAVENRVRTKAGNFTPKWHINPADATRRAYEIDRAQRILSGAYTSYVPKGMFLDSMDSGDMPSGTTTVEYNPANATTYFNDLAALLSGISAAVGRTPWRYQINTASYTDAHMTQVAEAAGSIHGESLLPYSGSGWPGSTLTYVLTLLAAGVNVEMLNDVSVSETDTTSMASALWASDPLPSASFASTASVRLAAASYYMVLLAWDPTLPGELAFNVWNANWTQPTADTGGIDHKWMALFDYPEGTPTAAYATLVSGATDPLGQSVAIYSRPFTNGLLVYRTVTGSGSHVYNDTAAYSATLPTSSGTGGAWQRVRSDGSLDAPITSIALRMREACFLVPAGGGTDSISLSPASAAVAAGSTTALTVTLLSASGTPIVSQAVSLSSDATGVATVPSSVTTNGSGQATFNVTGVATGTATVTASALGVTSAGASITVTTASPVATTVVISPSTVALGVSGTQQLTAVVLDQDGAAMPGETVTWSSSDTGVATVDSTGLVTAVAVGSATITATDGTISDTAAITVSATTRQLWFAADTLALSDGNVVGTWTDQVSAVTATQSGGSNKPTYHTSVFGAQPAVTFAATNYLTYTDPGATAWTRFFVAAPGSVSTPTGNAYLYYGPGSQVYITSDGKFGIEIVKASGAVMQFRTASGAITFGVKAIFELAYDGSDPADNNPTLLVNGASVALSLTSGSRDTVHSEAGSVALGGHNSANSLLGVVAEYVKIADTADHSDERTRLATKYGITLSS